MQRDERQRRWERICAGAGDERQVHGSLRANGVNVVSA
jgi:hypothetical protein